MSFALSKWPHFNSIYLVRVPFLNSIAVSPFYWILKIGENVENPVFLRCHCFWHRMKNIVKYQDLYSTDLNHVYYLQKFMLWLHQPWDCHTIHWNFWNSFFISLFLLCYNFRIFWWRNYRTYIYDKYHIFPLWYIKFDFVLCNVGGETCNFGLVASFYPKFCFVLCMLSYF